MLVQENGINFRCPGMFKGEAIVMVERDHHAIVFAIMALKPDLTTFLSTFKQLCEESFTQYIPFIKFNLCFFFVFF